MALNSPTRARGLTLLELLVTLAVIGIAVSAVTLSMSRAQDSGFDTEIERMRALFQMAQDETRIQANAIAWLADEDGYRFESTDDNLRAELRQTRAWPRRLERIEPRRILFGREPVMTPTIIRMHTQGQNLRLQLDALGNLERMP